MTQPEIENALAMMELTTQIVVAIAPRIATNEVANTIRDVHAAVKGCVMAETTASPAALLKPAVDPKKSIKDDFLICLEDGKQFKSLKRHLMAHYGLTPDQYRERWGLKPDYPMVAPNYAAARSQLAKKMGLGTSRNRRAA